jgi:hypothetical protein
MIVQCKRRGGSIGFVISFAILFVLAIFSTIARSAFGIVSFQAGIIDPGDNCKFRMRLRAKRWLNEMTLQLLIHRRAFRRCERSPCRMTS